MNIKAWMLVSVILSPMCASADPETTEMRIVTKVRLSECCIEYQGLITSEANDGVFELYQEASPKPTTLIIESHGGGAGAAMHLANWILDQELRSSRYVLLFQLRQLRVSCRAQQAAGRGCFDHVARRGHAARRARRSGTFAR